ncbi:UNKNOWN [Stylonychia lemnae]|uniref:Uncharacterized protein n=1 Tax=Stylonychia lemnae TaxID=5949 RepID=A0A078A7M9_STYLE|nr:UNKNOWN [Stylonychia lemnae]|eukprot:CDW78260.1 UNKNOWN [Stylonychia lemnae]
MKGRGGGGRSSGGSRSSSSSFRSSYSVGFYIGGGYYYSRNGVSGGIWWIPFTVIIGSILLLGIIVACLVKYMNIRCQTACCILLCCKCGSYREYEDELNKQEQKRLEIPQTVNPNFMAGATVIDRTAEIEAQMKAQQMGIAQPGMMMLDQNQNNQYMMIDDSAKMQMFQPSYPPPGQGYPQMIPNDNQQYANIQPGLYQMNDYSMNSVGYTNNGQNSTQGYPQGFNMPVGNDLNTYPPSQMGAYQQYPHSNLESIPENQYNNQ